MKTTDRIEYIRNFMNQEHFRYRTRDSAPRNDDETELTAEWGVSFDGEKTPLIRRMLSDFRTFCKTCMGIDLRPGGNESPRIHLIAHSAQQDFDRLDPGFEAFEITVGDREILIAAQHERGLLHGIHYLERMMADRGAPVLPLRKIFRSPAFMPRISNSIFIDSRQDIFEPKQFSDEYLGLMSHFGVNGIHLFAHLWEVSQSSVLPELNTPGFGERMEALTRLSDRAGQCGIDVYLCLVTSPLPESHPVFKEHEEVRGAASQTILHSTEPQYCLCSSQEKSLAFFDECIFNIFTASPDLSGIVSLVGGEGFHHCFTRPVTPYTGNSSCPFCKDIDPSAGVAELVNRCAGALKRTGKNKVYFAWPYSAFTWSGEDRTQQTWLGLLSDDVSVISNFDTGSPDKVNGDGVYLFDYNIKSIGPSDHFELQRSRLASLQKPIYAKVESSVMPHANFAPYIPVHQRWHRRFQAMRNAPVAGFIGQWRFFGMNGCLPEELQYHATWNSEEETEALLRRIAIRDFELSADDADRVVGGWQCMSDAWDHLPYSSMLSGERTNYFRGPLYMGPAHPLIFNPQDTYGLGPSFRKIRGDAIEGGPVNNEEGLAEMAPPHYVDQLLFVFPYGEERFLELIGACRAGWEDGVATLRSTFGDSPTDQARKELGICEIVGIHLATVENVAKFYLTRDKLWREHSDLETFNRDVAELQSIAASEIENARRSLPLLEQDPRIAFTHCYGNPYTTDMVREKIRQCEYVMNEELRIFNQEVRFHIWMQFP